MPSTAAVLLVRPRQVGVTASNRSTAAQFLVSLRTISGIFSDANFTNTTEGAAKSWLPPPRVPVTDPNTGVMTPEWYRFFRYIVEDRLGGPSAPSIPDVQTTVGSVQAAVTTNVQSVAGLTDAVNTNAQSLATTIQVSQQNNLSGASQIPEPVQARRPGEYLE